MAGLRSEQLQRRVPSTKVSLVDVLCQAPRLYQLVPQFSRQKLSATCSYLHQWVRETTTCVTLKRSGELPGLTPEKWPKLVGVVLHENGWDWYLDFDSLVQDKWQLDAQVCCSNVLLSKYQHKSVLLISPVGSSHEADFEFTPRQCQMLCQCLENERGKLPTSLLVPNSRLQMAMQ